MHRTYDYGAVKSRSVKILSKSEFVDTLKESREWSVHISARGKHEEETLIRSDIFSEIGSREFEEIQDGKESRKALAGAFVSMRGRS